jgi:hypothetical protein
MQVLGICFSCSSPATYRTVAPADIRLSRVDSDPINISDTVYMIVASTVDSVHFVACPSDASPKPAIDRPHVSRETDYQSAHVHPRNTVDFGNVRELRSLAV